MSTKSSQTPSALAFLLLVAGLSACGTNDTTPDPKSEVANPAAVYCSSHGGTDSLSDICTFSDGSICDQWAYFRGECNPGQCTSWQNCDGSTDGNLADPAPAAATACRSHCTPSPLDLYCGTQGGWTGARRNELTNGPLALCQFSDHSECEQGAFFRGECKQGDCTKWETCRASADGGA